MKNTHQLSIAALVVAGFAVTGCSQQQIAGGGASQVAGGSQQLASQSQVQTATAQKPKIVYKERVVVKYKNVCKANCAKPRPRSQWAHTHPAVPGCTNSVSHSHKYKNRNHRHAYSCRKSGRRVTATWGHTHPAIPGCTKSVRHSHKHKGAHSHKYSCGNKPRIHGKKYVRRVVSGGNRWTHNHPAIAGCTKSVRHTHKYKTRNHRHAYSCKGVKRTTYRAAKPPVDVYALQRKLKAKGYYKGPIDGIVGSGTRGALQRFMQNRR